MKISQLLSADGLDQLPPVREYFQVLGRNVILIVEEALLGLSGRLLVVFACASDEWRDVLIEYYVGEYTRELHLPIDHAYLSDKTWYTGQDLPSFLGISHHPTDAAVCGDYVYISTLFGARPVKAAFRLFLPILTVAALATTYNPFIHRATPQYPKDPRFSEFIFRSNGEPTVRDRTSSVSVYWSSMEASEARLTIAYFSQTGFLPDEDPEFWLTAVTTVPSKTVQLLVEGVVVDTLLPGIYPHLYEYVPQGCRLTTVGPELTDKTLVPDGERISRDFDSMNI